MAALLAGFYLSTTVANAACAPDPATSGQTVTCSGNDADGFQAGGGVNTLTVNVLSGATVNDNGTVAIGLNDSNVVTNNGTLTAGVGLTGLSFGNFNTVTNNATITVGDGGIGIAGLNSNTVTNNGTITATANGIAISIGDNSTITNSGTLAVGSFGTGIFAGQNENITNTATGIINVVDNGIGIYVAGNSTVTNAGTITTGFTVAAAGGIFAINDDNTIINALGATITVGHDAAGISVQGNRGTVSNAGAITAGDYGFGIGVAGDDAKVTSSGSIGVGDFGTSISVQGDRAVITNNGTTDGGVQSVGIAYFGSSGSITNSGRITGGYFSEGIFVVGNSNTITNSGTMNGGVQSVGIIYSGSSGTIINSGRITGGDFAAGIVVGGNSNTITNSGTITIGNSSPAAGIDVSGIAANSHNQVINAGTINVGTDATGIFVGNGGTVFNSGTINAATGFAAIEFCGCGTGNVLTLGPGSVINGFVLGTGTDTFQLGGTGKDTFNLSLIGPGLQYDGFTTFNKVDSSNWSVIGTGAQDWNVLGGTLSVNGTINGLVTVAAGGTLGGTGTIDNVFVNGGTLAPGNSIGTLNITNSLTFSAASSYMVEISGANSDLTRVGGVATLGGATVVVAPSGTVMKRYTILTATGGVPDTFNPVVAGVSSNLNPNLSYDANNVYLNFALNYGGGLNTNQQNVANALTNFFNTTGGIPVGFASLTPGGLTQVSGELATGSQQATFDAMNLFLSLLTDPFVAGRGFGAGGNGGAAPFADEGGANAYAASRSGTSRDAFAKFATKADVARNDLMDPRWSVWGSAYGGGSNTSGNATLGSQSATARAFGLAAGADYRISPDTLAGFALAGGGTNFSVAGFGTGRSDLFQAGAFVRRNFGAAYVTAAAAYGWQDVTTDRTVTAAGVDRLRAEFNANAWSGRVEGGYRFATPWMGITPYAAGQFTTYSLPAYAEQVLSGAGTFALNYAAKDVTASRTEFGVRTDKSFAMSNGILTLRGRAAWAHDFNTDRNVTALFQTLPGASFVVNGAAQVHDSALVTGAAEMKWLNGWSAAAIFEGQFSNVTNSYAGKGVARYSW